MITPTHADLGIEIGKAQAMAKASQDSIKRVEETLSDRMDRLETKVDKGFTEIKELVGNLHTDIVSMKIQESHNNGIEQEKSKTRSNWASAIALLISTMAAIAAFIGDFYPSGPVGK
jgi:hypothetical protein